MIAIYTAGSFHPDGNCGAWAFVCYRDEIKVHQLSGSGNAESIESARAGEALAILKGLAWALHEGYGGQRVVLVTYQISIFDLLNGMDQALVPIFERIEPLFKLFTDLRHVNVSGDVTTQAELLAQAELAGFRKMEQEKERLLNQIEIPYGSIEVQAAACIYPYPDHVGAFAFDVRDGELPLSRQVRAVDAALLSWQGDRLVFEAIAGALEDLRALEELGRRIWIKTSSKEVIERINTGDGMKNYYERVLVDRIRTLCDEFASVKFVLADGRGIRRASKLARAEARLLRDAKRARNSKFRKFRGLDGATGA